MDCNLTEMDALSASSLRSRADSAFEKGQFKESFRTFHKLWKLSHDPSVLARFGEALFRAGKIRRARCILEVAFWMKPTPSGGSLLMIVMSTQGDLQAERTMWEFCLKKLGSELPPEPW
jgi:hypothetical protein